MKAKQSFGDSSGRSGRTVLSCGRVAAGLGLAAALILTPGHLASRGLRETASLRLSVWKPRPRVAAASFRFGPSNGARHERFNSKTDLRPEWQRESGPIGPNVQQNSSVYSKVVNAAPPDAADDSIWKISVLERSAQVSPHSNQGKLQTQVRERLDQLQQGVEYRDRHHLLGQQEQLEWAQKNRALGRTFLRSLLSMQLRESLKKAEKRSPEVRAAAQVQQKIDFLATQGVAVQIDEGWNFGSRADLPRQTGRVWMTSPFLQSSLDFKVGGQDTGLGDRGSEALRWAVERPLLWDIQSGIVYGGSSHTITTQLSRALSPNLTCSLENRQAWSEARAEQTARFDYQLVF